MSQEEQLAYKQYARECGEELALSANIDRNAPLEDFQIEYLANKNKPVKPKVKRAASDWTFTQTCLFLVLCYFCLPLAGMIAFYCIMKDSVCQPINKKEIE